MITRKPVVEDDDFNCNIRVKRPKRITVTIPVDLMSAEITKSFDRSKISDGAAMQIYSPMLQSFQTLDGTSVLSQVKLSRRTIGRQRNKFWDEISDEAYEEFLADMPTCQTLTTSFTSLRLDWCPDGRSTQRAR